MIGEITPFDLRWPVIVAILLIAVSSFGHLEVPTLHIKALKSGSELHNLYNTIYVFIPCCINPSALCHKFKYRDQNLFPCLNKLLWLLAIVCVTTLLYLKGFLFFFKYCTEIMSFVNTWVSFKLHIHIFCSIPICIFKKGNWSYQQYCMLYCQLATEMNIWFEHLKYMYGSIIDNAFKTSYNQLYTLTKMKYKVQINIYCICQLTCSL